MLGFEESCLPAQGRLLALLAAGVGDGTIGETGTGCGVGLARMAQAAHPAARLTSIESTSGHRDTSPMWTCHGCAAGGGQDSMPSS